MNVVVFLVGVFVPIVGHILDTILIADTLQIPNAERLAPDAWMARVGELPLVYEPGVRWLYHVAAEILG